jgi:2-oxoglutarate/2-oxoacid ferredoxin oxidoreductase subunit alpha
LGVNKVSIRIGGPAGAGIMQAGLMLSKACSRIGLHVFDYIEYPSLIRGGHNTYLVRADAEPVRSQVKHVDVLIALDEPTLTIHAGELDKESIVIYDPAAVHPENTKLGLGILCPVPLKELVAAVGGPEIMQNTVALAAALGILDFDFSVFEGIIKDQFDAKKAEVAQQNIDVARKGYDYAQQQYEKHSHHRLTAVKAPKRMVMTGNEAIALGAVAAGMKFFAAYPMTPASSILHVLAGWQEKHDLIIKHAEDEISVINMGVGAGYAGVRSMVATSGGGYALMNEGVSLAAITEVPVVVVEVQRPGPATGMPTWTDQGDLKYVLSSGHGEFTHFVLAPGDVEECFSLTAEAFNIAEKYQTPVFVMSDKYLAESHKTAEKFGKVRIERGKLLRSPQKNYLRYADTADGISPRTIPGVPGGFFLANSYEHNEYGWTSEDGSVRVRMSQKRARKEETYRKEMPQPSLVGAKDADLTIVGWGSTKGPILDAMDWLAKDGVKVNFLQLTHISPFPVETVQKLLRAAKRTLLIENNATGQLGSVIREQTGIELKERFLRSDGRPFCPEDIYDKVKSMLGGHA